MSQENSVNFLVFVVPNKGVLLGNANVLGNYGIFKPLQWEDDVKKVFKSFSCSIMLDIACTKYFKVQSVAIICRRRYMLKKVWR